MICDYYVVRKGYLQTRDLYSASKDSPYYFCCGFSWHAYAAYLSGLLVNIVGFAGAVGRKVPIGATYIYNVNYVSGFLVSFAMYYALTWAVPIPATSAVWNEVDVDVDDDPMSVADGEEVYGDERWEREGEEGEGEGYRGLKGRDRDYKGAKSGLRGL